MGKANPSVLIDVAPEDWQELMAIVGRLAGGRDVWAFGSRTIGRAKRFSDLDLAFEGAEALSLEQLAELSEAFEQSDLPFRVDVVDLATADASLGSRVRRDGVLLQRGGKL